MAITIDSYGTQATDAVAVGHSPVNGRDWAGSVQRLWFDYTVPAGGEADGNNVAAVLSIPKGARLLGGTVKTTACGTGADLDVGLRGSDGDGTYDGSTADDDDFLAAGLDVDAISSVAFGNTIALNFGYVLLKDCDLILTVETAAWDAAAVLRGYIDVLVV
jgi:hypothetical protein